MVPAQARTVDDFGATGALSKRADDVEWFDLHQLFSHLVALFAGALTGVGAAVLVLRSPGFAAVFAAILTSAFALFVAVVWGGVVPIESLPETLRELYSILLFGVGLFFGLAGSTGTLGDMRRRRRQIAEQESRSQRVDGGAGLDLRIDRWTTATIDRITRGVLASITFAKGVGDLTTTIGLPDLFGTTRFESASAHRVLNANFFRADNAIEISTFEALEPGSSYHLRVDIGPEWKHAKSIVTGARTFPEDTLPESTNGHEIKVVFASEDFTCGDGDQHIVSALLWLPRYAGQSHPIIDGVASKASGAVVLHVVAPTLAPGALPIIAKGRLGLYFENNLLQSAQVRVTVGHAGAKVVEPNDIHVDFALTGSFRDCASLATRDIAPLSRRDARRVAVNFTLNDGSGSSHHIIVPSLKEPIYIRYDPVGMRDLLNRTRARIAECYWKRDPNSGEVLEAQDGRIFGIGEQDNGRSSLADFMWDLLTLAEHGQQLYDAVFSDLTNAQKKALDDAVAESIPIQIARTGGPPNFVFPWGLVYDYPLVTRSDYRFCPIIEEWNSDGRRDNRRTDANCPHRHKPMHRENVLCPYGFWGLRHRIEQPPNLQEKTAHSDQVERIIHIEAGDELLLHAAFTTDTALDRRQLDAHATRLSKIGKLRFAPPPATDWGGVRALLKDTRLVYFLCHGEFDDLRGIPYIGVGLRDGQPQHRVYPDRLGAFFRKHIDPAVWSRNSPLIFINGCHTADLVPGQLLNFISTFSSAGASGVIGTEVSVVLPVAAEVGEMLLESLANGHAVADAIRAMRWSLANRGNLLGLAYTPYCFADLKFRVGA